MSDSELDRTTRALVRIVDAIDTAVDDKDWVAARAPFADQVRVDTSTLNGQPAALMAADDLIGGWAKNLTAAKTSLHLRTNHAVTIDGERAAVRSHAYAWNRMEGGGDPLWETWGKYEHRFTRADGEWRIDGFTFEMTHERGNPWVKSTIPDA